MRIRTASLLTVLLLAGCTSMDPDDGLVSITTTSNGQPIDNAQCAVSTRSASWNVVTPATLNVGPGDGDLRIVCKKAGYRVSELILPPYAQATGSSFGLGMGGGSGNVGMGLGMSFPLTTNGWYPASIVVNMNPL
ncbi:MAG TPA: hypothetical protein VN361_03360 [Oxalicibacterium sp.]|nr:hypothetical protein [Oxalicibacterium sp.]